MGEDKESVTITAEPDDVQETAAVPRGDSKHAGSAVQGSTKRRMARDMSHKLTSTRKGGMYGNITEPMIRRRWSFDLNGS